MANFPKIKQISDLQKRLKKAKGEAKRLTAEFEIFGQDQEDAAAKYKAAKHAVKTIEDELTAVKESYQRYSAENVKIAAA